MVRFDGCGNVGDANSGAPKELPKHQKSLLRCINNSDYLVNIYDSNKSGKVTMDELMTALNGGISINDDNFGFGSAPDLSAEIIRDNATRSRKTHHFRDVDGKAYYLTLVNNDKDQKTEYQTQFDLENNSKFVERTDYFTTENGDSASYRYKNSKKGGESFYLSYHLPDGKEQDVDITYNNINGEVVQVARIFTTEKNVMNEEVVLNGERIKYTGHSQDGEKHYYDGNGNEISWFDYVDIRDQ